MHLHLQSASQSLSDSIRELETVLSIVDELEETEEAEPPFPIGELEMTLGQVRRSLRKVDTMLKKAESHV